MLLLVPVAAGAAHLLKHGTSRRIAIGLGVMALVNAVALTIREGSHFVWLPPAVLAWYAWAMSTAEPASRSDELDAARVAEPETLAATAR
jgi:hypothetical protein